MHGRRQGVCVAFAFLLLAVGGCDRGPRSGEVLDEARAVGREPASFPHSAVDYFKDMDGGVVFNEREVAGRNMWIVWTGGNDRFWDRMSVETFGAFDLLKTITSSPAAGQAFHRGNRWANLGLVNEPCFTAATAPDAFGLYLDARTGGEGCAPDPFADEAAYPGVKTGFRGQAFKADTRFADGTRPPARLPIGSYYGYPSGVVGLRLFPNPAFDDEAAKKWNPKRYYSDPGYYNDPKLVRPYRVGMSCGFCHVGPSPIAPPADPENPTFANLSSTVGAQYMWVDRLFIHEADPKNYMYQLVHTYRPGAMDTSLVSTDMINNPRTMNAIYSLDDRMGLAATDVLPGGARYLGRERLKGGERNNKQFNTYVSDGPLTGFYKAPGDVLTPRVLKDGSDSVGALGALNRVYINIGLFSEEWFLHFNPVAGGKTITPMRISVAEENSSYWQATEAGTPNTALFFLKAGRPDRLSLAPGGAAHVADPATLARGKQAFADTCARCHSSKLPATAVADLTEDRCVGHGYLQCFSKYWKKSQTPAFKSEMRKIVNAPDFLERNYLSAEFRVPVTLLRTNACSPLATNALRGNIWNDFSSDTYKELPSVGTITLADPFTGAMKPYRMPAGGRGYTRPPSLIALWSTAPFLLNNTVGKQAYRTETDPRGRPFVASPLVGVDDRLREFQPAIEQMLWPERREMDSVLGTKAHGLIDRTTEVSWLIIAPAFVPSNLKPVQGILKGFYPGMVYDAAKHDEFNRATPGYPKMPASMNGAIVLGPIPKGMPVNILANTRLRAESSNPFEGLANVWRLLTVAHRLKQDLRTLPAGTTGDALRTHFADVREPLLKLSKCPDFVVNRGHLFGTRQFNLQDGLSADEKAWGTETPLSDADKAALIAFLKTF